MRKEPLLTAVPPVPVASLSELYAVAFDQAQKATQRYGALATQPDERLLPVRAVFAVLSARERERCDSLSAACVATCGRRPDGSDLRWPPIDLVAPTEIAEIGNSSLATPYTAWALATRHRQRAVSLRGLPRLVERNGIELAEACHRDGRCGGQERLFAHVGLSLAISLNQSSCGLFDPAQVTVLPVALG